MYIYIYIYIYIIYIYMYLCGVCGCACAGACACVCVGVCVGESPKAEERETKRCINISPDPLIRALLKLSFAGFLMSPIVSMYQKRLGSNF